MHKLSILHYTLFIYFLNTTHFLKIIALCTSSYFLAPSFFAPIAYLIVTNPTFILVRSYFDNFYVAVVRDLFINGDRPSEPLFHSFTIAFTRIFFASSITTLSSSYSTKFLCSHNANDISYRFLITLVDHWLPDFIDLFHS